MLFAFRLKHIGCWKQMQTVKREVKNKAMAFLHENNIDLELESFNDDDEDEDERCHGLFIRRTRSYSTRTDTKSSRLSARETTDTNGVNQAIACALKSTPKVFQYIQKHLQYIPPSIKHLAACQTIRELDLHGNELKILPNEIDCLQAVEICNLGKNFVLVIDRIVIVM